MKNINEIAGYVLNSLEMGHKVEIINSGNAEFAYYTDKDTNINKILVDKNNYDDLYMSLYNLYSKVYISGVGVHIKSKALKGLIIHEDNITHLTILSIVKFAMPYADDLELLSHFYTVLLRYNFEKAGK